jgi:glycosyltransferase involved in cell wall biosynthesis
MKRLKSLLFILPGLGFGGAEILTLKIIDYLISTHRFTVSLIVIGDNLDLLPQLNPSCPLICLNLSIRPQPLKTFSSFLLALESFKQANVVLPTLYISQLFVVFLSAVTFRRRPTLACVHNCSFFLREIGISSYFSLISFFLFRFYPHIAYIFCSHTSFLSHKAFIARSDSFLITNGYTRPDKYPDISLTTLPQCLKHSRTASGPPRILFIARYHPHKDYRTFLLTLLTLSNTCSNFSVTVVGATYEQICKCISKLNVPESVKHQLTELVIEHISIYSPHSNVSYFYENHDILLLTSLSEAFPNVVVEAQVFGLYVVSTDVGDISQMVYDPNLLAPHSNYSLLCQRLISAIKLLQSGCNSIHKQNIISFAESKFSTLAMLQSYEDLLQSWPLS